MAAAFEEVMGVREAFSGLEQPAADEVTISGADAVFSTRFKIGETCAAVLGGVGVAVSDIWELKTGRRQKASIRRAGRERARAKERAAEHSREATPPREHEPGKQKSRQGLVVSDRADKTITVRIDLARRHRRYSKVVRTTTTLHVHDERNDAHIGDTVLVRECRPLSRTKRWRLIEVLERAK